MLITPENLQRLSAGFQTSFKAGISEVEPVYSKIAMTTKSSGSEETYAWLGQLPSIREWFGGRVVHGLQAHGYTITNRKIESTVEVPRTTIEDDKVGVYGPMFQDMGRRAAEHPDQLFAELVAGGFTGMCYDGQNFFDEDHPVLATPTGPIISVSNVQAGDGVAWYMLDLSRAIRPFIYQERIPFQMTRLDKADDDNVFWQDNYVYGVRGRSAVGYGLWQLARASRAPLNSTNFELNRNAMASLRGDNDKKLGVRCTHILVPPELEGDARRTLKSQLVNGGESNPWVDAAEIIVSPWL